MTTRTRTIPAIPWTLAIVLIAGLAGPSRGQSPPSDTGRVEPIDQHLIEFAERQKANRFGQFLDSAAIARTRARLMSDVLRRVPGVQIRPSTAAGNAVRFRSCASGPNAGDRGIPVLWVDGVRVPGAEIDEVIRPADVAGVEIYSSLAGVPAPYMDRSAVCGTLLVWTKSSEQQR